MPPSQRSTSGRFSKAAVPINYVSKAVTLFWCALAEQCKVKLSRSGAARAHKYYGSVQKLSR